MTADPQQLWDPLAGWWQRTFTAGADPEYDRQIMPLVAAEIAGARRLLDLGCGEGQVTRALVETRRAASAVGIDPSRRQLDNAGAGRAGAHGAGRAEVIAFAQARGEALPFRDASFDAVVCCLVIEHADDVDAVLAEVARVLEPGGQFLLLVNHPLFQGPGSGFIDDQVLGEHYWRVGPYLTEAVAWEHVDAGVSLPFSHRPLSRYLNPLAAADLLLVHMIEPAPHPEFLAASLDPGLESTIPRLLAMHFERMPRPGGGAKMRATRREAGDG